MTETLWQKLEAFQGELLKCVLKRPRYHSNTAAIMALEVPTMRYGIFVRKLGFLHCVIMSDPVPNFNTNGGT